MGWRDFQVAIPIDNIDKIDNMPSQPHFVDKVDFVYGGMSEKKESEKGPEQGKLLIPWKTESGRIIYLAEDERAAIQAPLGKACFLLSELQKMQGIDRLAAEKLIDVKEVFGNEAKILF